MAISSFCKISCRQMSSNGEKACEAHVAVGQIIYNFQRMLTVAGLRDLLGNLVIDIIHLHARLSTRSAIAPMQAPGLHFIGAQIPSDTPPFAVGHPVGCQIPCEIRSGAGPGLGSRR